MERVSYDIIIAGAGPGGLSCALYGTRAGLSVLVLDRGMPGGQMAMTEWIDNYPGFPDGVSGQELSEKMLAHAQRFGAEVAYGNISEFSGKRNDDCLFEISLDTGETTYAKAFVISTGAKPKVIGLPGETALLGRGVSYCAVCDGNFFKGKEVCVIGGGDSAVEEAVYLSKLCSKVTVVHRRDVLRAAQTAQDAAFTRKNIEFAYNSQIEDVVGDKMVEGVLVKDTITGEQRTIPCAGAFFYAGIIPQSDLVKGIVDMDEQNFIKTDENMETSFCGVYAIGDVRRPAYRQITSAVSDGTTAALHIDMAIHHQPDRWR